MRLAISILISSFLVLLLLSGVSELPTFGNPYNPDNNELSHSYIENTVKDTSALNIVTAIVLDYRAMDTFMEASVLFSGAILVLLIFKKQEDK